MPLNPWRAACEAMTNITTNKMSGFSRRLQRRVLRKKKKKKTFAQAHQPTTTTVPSPHESLRYHRHTTTTTLPSLHYHTTITLPPPHYHHHTTITTRPSPQYHVGWIASVRCLLNSLLFLRLGWVSPRLARCTPLRGSCVSECSRCFSFLRILKCPRAPSAGIVRVGALPRCLQSRLL